MYLSEFALHSIRSNAFCFSDKEINQSCRSHQLKLTCPNCQKTRLGLRTIQYLADLEDTGYGIRGVV
ncbi:hypothetical protein BDV97DRAFT_362128 [Delphinella strobiligena]|nr:hypothetical protein BDV97DRAFT_362128 [Delphinella strobiligena]